MANCDDCGKKFGFFEKIYESEDAKKYCELCVKAADSKVDLNSTNEVPSDTYVTLQDKPVSVNMPKSQSKDEWEFRVVKLTIDSIEKRNAISIEKIEEVINKMGKDGWELVSVLPLNTLLMKREGLDQPAMIFKKKKDTMSVGY